MSEEYIKEEQEEADEDFLETEQEVVDTSTEKIKSGLRFTRYFILLIMILAALILLFFNKDKINIDNFKRLATKIDIGISNNKNTDNTIIKYDYDSSGSVAAYKDGIARVTSDSLVVMDNMGTEFQSVLIGLNNPAIVTSDKYVLVYDRGGTRLAVTNSFEVLFDKNFEDNIVSVSLNDNGYFVVITESEAYKNKMIVFNSSFKEIYRINSLNRYFICADITTDNDYIIASSLYVKDSNVTPQVNCYKVTSEKTVWNCDFDNNVAVDIRANSDDTISLLFEWGICTLNSDGEIIYKFDFDTKILQCYSFGGDKYNAAVISESLSGDSEIVIFDNKGKKIEKIKLTEQVISVDIRGDNVAVLTRKNLIVYSTSGKRRLLRENLNDAMLAVFSGNKSIMIIGASSAIYNLLK